MAAAIIQLASGGNRGFIVIQQLAGGGIERLGEHGGFLVAGFNA